MIFILFLTMPAKMSLPTLVFKGTPEKTNFQLVSMTVALALQIFAEKEEFSVEGMFVGLSIYEIFHIEHEFNG